MNPTGDASNTHSPERWPRADPGEPTKESRPKTSGLRPYLLPQKNGPQRSAPLARRAGDSRVSRLRQAKLDCEGKRQAPEPVGLVSFGMDSHVVQHFVTENGKVQNEGVIWRVPPKPYGISYRSIIPRKGECENLFSPICLSASHVAHGSIRMEPVFMALSQSAAIAAGLAIVSKVSVQEVAYPGLREKMLSAKQIVDVSQVPARKHKTAKRKATP